MSAGSRPRVERLVVISDRLRFVWVQVPKVASTTLHATIASWRDASEEGAGDAPSHRRPGRRVLRDAALRQCVVDDEGLQDLVRRFPDFLFFCFVRDPYARLLSAYANKLTRFALAFRPGVYLASKVYGYSTGWPTRHASHRGLDYLRRHISFAECVETLRDRGLGIDGHFYTQVDIVRPDIVPYGVVGRLETLADDVETIRNQLGFVAPSAAEEWPRLNSTGAGDKLDAVYTPRLHGIVHDLYRGDFERFGYAA